MFIKSIFLSLAFIGQAALASAEHTAPTMPKEFDTMKGLVGTWEGTANMHGKDQDVTVTYELTSGGTAVVEKLMPGTPHEMVTVYHKDGKTLGMTHYCSMGNQPHMKLQKADATMMKFEMTKPMGVESMKEPHMHALTLSMATPDTLKQEWVDYENGKQKDTTVFSLKRKK